jgi:hypothetical protein
MKSFDSDFLASRRASLNTVAKYAITYDVFSLAGPL